MHCLGRSKLPEIGRIGRGRPEVLPNIGEVGNVIGELQGICGQWEKKIKDGKRKIYPICCQPLGHITVAYQKGHRTKFLAFPSFLPSFLPSLLYYCWNLDSRGHASMRDARVRFSLSFSRFYDPPSAFRFLTYIGSYVDVFPHPFASRAHRGQTRTHYLCCFSLSSDSEHRFQQLQGVFSLHIWWGFLR